MQDKPHSILIIDDSSYMLRSVLELMTAAGYEAAGASSGEEGYQLAKEMKPDLVLLDVMLPDIDGVELCRRMKAEPDLTGTYIILLSGIKNDSESQARGLEVGADDFIAKSASERELLARVQTMLRIKHTEIRLSDTLQELREKHRELLNTQTQLQASQKKFEELYDFAPVGYCSFDRLGIALEANLTIADQLGVDRKDLIDMPLFPYIPDEDHATFRQHLNSVFKSKTPQTCEIKLYQKNGMVFWVLLKSLLASSTAGLRYECRTVISDISERKQSEKALRDSEERYRTLVENLQQNVFYKDRNSAYVTCNENYARELHLTPKEIVGKTDYDFFPGALADKYRLDDKKVLESGGTLNVEESYIHDGQESFIQTIKTPIRDSGGNIIGLLGIFWDITERKRGEEVLQQRTVELAQRVKELNCLYSMSNLVEQADISLEGILQGTVELIPPALQHPAMACARLTLDDQQFITDNFQETVWKQITPLIVYNTQRGRLDVYYLEERPESHGGPFLAEERKLLNAVIGRLGRIIERRWTEEALEKSEQRFKVLVETMNEGLAAIDENMTFTYMNNKFCEMVGYNCDELLGQSSFMIVVQQQQALHRAQLDRRKMGEFGTYETLLLRKDGSHFPVILSGSPLFDIDGNFTGTLGIFTDISQLKHTEEALRESETRYRRLFEDSPVSLWEEDLSQLKAYLDDLRNKGVEDYAMYFETHPEVIRHCIQNIHVVDINNASLTLYKAPNKRELLMNLEKVFTEDASNTFKKVLLTLVSGQSVFEFETTNRTLQGDTIYVRLKYSIAPDYRNTLTRVLISIMNLTERKRIEDALTQERYLLHSLMDNSPDHIYFKDVESHFIRLNKAGREWVHLDNSIEAVGKTDFDFFAEEHACKAFADEQRIVQTGEPLVGLEEKEVWPDGKESWVSTTKMPYYDKFGNIVGTFGISRDITQHKQSEERQQFATQVLEILNRSDRKIDTIRKILLMMKQFTRFEAVGIRLRDREDFPYYETYGFPEKFVEAESFLCTRDQAGEILMDSDGNPYLECMCGNVLCERTNPDLPFFTAHGSFWTNSTSELLASTTEEDRQARTRNRCNGEGYESVALVPLRSRNRIIGLIQLNDRREGKLTPEFIRFFEGIGASIGIALEHRQTEDEMARLRNFMKNIIDSMPSVLVGIDREGRVTHWNLQAEKTTGLSSEKVQGRELREVFPQLMQYMEKVQLTIQQREPQKEEQVISQIGGDIKYTNVMIYPLVSNGVEGAVIRVDDVTERVRFEEMMIQSEKMLSVGGLAAGMAHELNNPLASILQNTQVILNRLTKNFPANSLDAIESGTTVKAIKSYMGKRDILQMLELIQSSGERAAQIVSDMLSFSRKSGSYTLPHDLRKLLDKTIELASHVYDFKNKYDFQRFKIIREYDPFLPEIPCEQNQIQQVILNLLTNAVQAISEQKGPKEESKIILRTIRDNDMARVEIEDNGPGMPEDTRKRVFEPFFTTKAVGVGTGLGLSVSYFIITEHHHGTMSVESEPEKGTKFIIWLPLKGKPVKKDLGDS